MTDKAIEAACNAYVEHERYGLEEAIRTAIAVYEQALWRPIAECPRSEALLIGGGDILYPIVASRSGKRNDPWRLDAQAMPCDEITGRPTHYHPLPPTPGKEG